MDKLSVVERFNGGNFQALPVDQSATLSYTILRAQQALIDQSYQALKSSVYACPERSRRESLLVLNDCLQAANDGKWRIAA